MNLASNYPTRIFISPDKPELQLDEAETLGRRTWFEHKLVQLGFNFRKVSGAYKGKPETSYMVLIDSDDQLPSLYRLAEAFKQESVLLLDSNGYAALFDADGRHLAELGKFVRVSREEAVEQDAWTYVDGAYYITRKGH